jgi:hypothetical protein
MNEERQENGWLEVLGQRPLRGRRGWTVYALLLGLLGLVYFWLGSVLIGTTNGRLQEADQRANLDLAYASSGDWYPHRSSYVQPLWPWLSRVVMDGDIEVYFVRGRWLNLALGFAVTVLLAVLAAWWLAPVPGFTVGWVAGIGVMLQRSHFFQPEPLLYALLTAAAVFMALTFWRTRWLDYAAWGFFLGLAYLAKASTAPLLAAYLGAWLVLASVRAGWWPRFVVTREGAPAWSARREVAGLLLALCCAGAVMAPGAVHKLRVHGDAFFNPAKYWMWCEDWDNGAVPVTPRLQTSEGRASFAPGELPTAANYLRRHGWAHAGERLSRGVREMGWRFVVPVHKTERALQFRMLRGKAERGEPEKFWRYLLPARGLYLLWFAALGLLLLAARRRTEGGPLFRSAAAPATIAFGAAAVAVYLLAFGWYAPIINWRGERFTLMWYLPLLIGFAWAAAVLARDLAGTGWKYVYVTAVALVLAHALVQTGFLVARPFFAEGI